jgi:ABC-2 type transport system permease protein
VFYALDALNGERRDRSILFWKSMPVSDLTAVLAKAAIPLAVLPCVAMAMAVLMQIVMLALHTAVFAVNGVSPAELWTRLPLVRMDIVMVYGVTVHALWFAPIYAYFLMVSAWARRGAFLWAFLPVFSIYAVETVATGRSFIGYLLGYRIVGAMSEAFKPGAMKAPIVSLSQLDPVRFVSSPGLWLGLAFAAACIAATVRLRRRQEPN